MVKIYTRTGDGGETSLLSGGRVGKDHPLVEAYGSLDELSAILGLLQCEALPTGTGAQLTGIQEALFEIGSALADRERRADMDPTLWATGPLESWIDAMEKELEPLTAFILPGGCRGAALAHLARTVCRRAERRVRAVALAEQPAGVLPYLNRLSDLLFVLARWLNHRVGFAERRWRGRAAAGNEP